jgi:cytosine/adenosine deaminase-related metal-dependent hydrolase
MTYFIAGMVRIPARFARLYFLHSMHRQLLAIALFACSAFGQDLVIRNVVVVDVDSPVPRIVENRTITIRGGVIASITGPGEDPAGAGENDIDGSRFIALPGFINTHTHLWQHVAKGIAPSARLQEWVPAVYRTGRSLTPAEVGDVTRAAAAEALLSGFTAVIDFASVNSASGNLRAVVDALAELQLDGAVVYWHDAPFLRAAEKEAEIRVLQRVAPDRLEIWMGYGPLSFFGVPAVYDGIALAQRNGLRMTEHTMENVGEQRFMQSTLEEYLRDFGDKLAESDRTAIRNAIAPALPKSDAFVRLQRLAGQILESDPDLGPEERAILEKIPSYKTPSPVSLLDHLGGIPPGFVSIHSVWQTPDDLDLYARRGAFVSYNPESNMYLSSGAAPMLWWRSRPALGVSLGTDGAASNDAINAFAAMRAAVDVQKLEIANAGVSAAITPWEILRMATLGGARALRREERIGSIAVGKEADLVLMSADRLGMTPFTPHSAAQVAAVIVNAASPRDVDTVISNGRVMVRGGALASGGEARLAQGLTAAANDAARRLQNGAVWEQTFAARHGDAPFYRMVFPADTVKVTIRNDVAMNVDLHFSGTVFGGAAAPMLHGESTRRFPADAPPAYSAWGFGLRRNDVLTIERKANSREWVMTAGGKTHTRTGPAGAEQVHLSWRAAP